MRIVDEGSADPVNSNGKTSHNSSNDRVKEAHGALDKDAGISELGVGAVEFLILVFFGIVGADDADAGEVFAGDAVDVVDKSLDDFELWHGDDNHGDNSG